MTVVATDDFNRSDGNLSTPWEQQVGGQNLLIASNQCGSDTAGSYAACYYDDTFDDDHYSQAQLKVLTGAPGLLVRAQAGQDRQYYHCRIAFGQIFISEQAGSASNDLATDNDPGFEADDVLRFEAEGTALRMYRNSDLVLQTTDATYSGGKPGIHIHFGTSARLDDWEGGNLGAGGPVIPVLAHHYRRMKVT